MFNLPWNKSSATSPKVKQKIKAKFPKEDIASIFRGNLLNDHFFMYYEPGIILKYFISYIYIPQQWELAKAILLWFW